MCVWISFHGSVLSEMEQAGCTLTQITVAAFDSDCCDCHLILSKTCPIHAPIHLFWVDHCQHVCTTSGYLSPLHTDINVLPKSHSRRWSHLNLLLSSWRNSHSMLSSYRRSIERCSVWRRRLIWCVCDPILALFRILSFFVFAWKIKISSICWWGYVVSANGDIVISAYDLSYFY